ncbi:hypothetical protein FOL47_011273 [Perkinsus chesapeaki]|uniref:Uncharacterized protein n=1 Tax=Perkinsus chesapeaki TaxID=330153 RepID=A0A7J6KYT2_PERCH|nr:hypothetical protein FOL47_011273 [Perkinsus chesapeaki]
MYKNITDGTTTKVIVGAYSETIKNKKGETEFDARLLYITRAEYVPLERKGFDEEWSNKVEVLKTQKGHRKLKIQSGKDKEEKHIVDSAVYGLGRSTERIDELGGGTMFEVADASMEDRNAQTYDVRINGNLELDRLQRSSSSSAGSRFDECMDVNIDAYAVMKIMKVEEQYRKFGKDKLDTPESRLKVYAKAALGADGLKSGGHAATGAAGTIIKADDIHNNDDAVEAIHLGVTRRRQGTTQQHQQPSISGAHNNKPTTSHLKGGKSSSSSSEAAACEMSITYSHGSRTRKVTVGARAFMKKDHQSVEFDAKLKYIEKYYKGAWDPRLYGKEATKEKCEEYIRKLGINLFYTKGFEGEWSKAHIDVRINEDYQIDRLQKIEVSWGIDKCIDTPHDVKPDVIAKLRDAGGQRHNINTLKERYTPEEMIMSFGKTLFPANTAPHGGDDKLEIKDVDEAVEAIYVAVTGQGLSNLQK